MTLYHTDTPGTPDMVPGSAQWFETWSPATGAPHSLPPSVIDPTARQT